MILNLVQIKYQRECKYTRLPFDWCCNEFKNDENITLTKKS